MVPKHRRGLHDESEKQVSAADSVLAQIFQNPTGNILVEQVSNGDTTQIEKRSLDYLNSGISHAIPIATQLNVATYINIQPSINYREYWYNRTSDYTYDPNTQEVKSKYVYGFATARDFNANLTASSRIYGLFGGGGKRGTTVRHTFQPSVGYAYKPDFSDDIWGFYQTVQVDSTGKTDRYNRFAGGIQGSPGAGEQQEINATLNNILEMKYRTRVAEQDTAIKDPYTRLTLIDNFGIGGKYNFAAKTFKVSPITFNARTNILNNKFNFQIFGALDPYAVNASGTRIDTFLYDYNRSLVRLSSFTFTFNTVLASKKVDGTKTSKTATSQELNELKLYRDLYVDFQVPWKLTLSTNLGYTNNGKTKDTTMTVNATGDFNMTPKWKIGFTTGYDFANSDFSYTSLTLYRDLHCWEMAMTWIPFGLRKSYNFTINVKSSTLKDLKLTKRRDWQDRF